MTRMLQDVHKGDDWTLVEQHLDWVAGDKLYFAPTNMQPWHGEYMEISEYNSKTGKLVLTEPFEWYHFGGDSTAAKYNGIDMRCEIVLLTRNVKVIGESSNDWGGAIVTADRIEEDRTFRIGKMTLDNVEVYRCGQEDTYKSAIRFEGAMKGAPGEKVVEGSVVWGGNGKNLIIKTSKNVIVNNSAFVGAQQVGVQLQTVNNVHLNGLFVADVRRRILNANLMTIDKEAGISLCSFTNGDRCPDTTV